MYQLELTFGCKLLQRRLLWCIAHFRVAGRCGGADNVSADAREDLLIRLVRQLAKSSVQLIHVILLYCPEPMLLGGRRAASIDLSADVHSCMDQ